MNVIKLFSLFALFIGVYGLSNEENLDSAMTNDEDETIMKLYEKDEDDGFDDENAFPLHGNAFLDESMDVQMEKRSRYACSFRRQACRFACRRYSGYLGGICNGICNFALRYANRPACNFACNRVPPLLRGICKNVCRCLRG